MTRGHDQKARVHAGVKMTEAHLGYRAIVPSACIAADIYRSNAAIPAVIILSVVASVVMTLLAGFFGGPIRHFRAPVKNISLLTRLVK